MAGNVLRFSRNTQPYSPVNIVQITPGAGGMYCGNCFRDNALVAEMRRKGHPTLMVPLYMPMTLDEESTVGDTPIFFNGINVYLEQKSQFFRRAPKWLHKITGSALFLKLAVRRAAKTRAEDVGELMISMLQGEEGNQARELDELIAFLQTQDKPDVVCLSNMMLAGLARGIRQRLDTRVVCMLQGEDAYVDAMPPQWSRQAWAAMQERAKDIDLFIAPSEYFADLMTRRLHLPKGKVKVVHNGINLDGFSVEPQPANPPIIGFLARMCPEKGLDTLVQAFMILKSRDRIPGLQLWIAGGCGPGDEPFVSRIHQRLTRGGWMPSVRFKPNLTRKEKQQFLRSLSVLSVPALYGEAFGLYLIEALASGVPVVQPRHAAFPELVEKTGGGLICEPGNPNSLADALEQLLLHPVKAKSLGLVGRQAVEEQFSVSAMAESTIKVFRDLLNEQPAPRPDTPQPVS